MSFRMFVRIFPEKEKILAEIFLCEKSFDNAGVGTLFASIFLRPQWKCAKFSLSF